MGFSFQDHPSWQHDGVGFFEYVDTLRGLGVLPKSAGNLRQKFLLRAVLNFPRTFFQPLTRHNPHFKLAKATKATLILPQPESFVALTGHPVTAALGEQAPELALAFLPGCA